MDVTEHLSEIYGSEPSLLLLSDSAEFPLSNKNRITAEPPKVSNLLKSTQFHTTSSYWYTEEIYWDVFAGQEIATRFCHWQRSKRHCPSFCWTFSTSLVLELEMMKIGRFLVQLSGGRATKHYSNFIVLTSGIINGNFRVQLIFGFPLCFLFLWDSFESLLGWTVNISLIMLVLNYWGKTTMSEVSLCPPSLRCNKVSDQNWFFCIEGKVVAMAQFWFHRASLIYSSLWSGNSQARHSFSNTTYVCPGIKVVQKKAGNSNRTKVQ